MSAHTNTAFTSIAAATSVAAGGTVNGTVIDLGLNHDGGIVYLTITNGATGPSASCVLSVMLSKLSFGGTAPTAAAAGTEWHPAFDLDGSTINAQVTRASYRFLPDTRYLFVRATGNTVQAVTVEAVGVTFAYA